MSEEKKKTMASALDKMETESALLGQESRKVRIKDKHHHRQEIENHRKIKTEQEIEEKEFKQFEFRSLTTQIVLGGIITCIVVWSLNRNQRTTLIENGIIIFLCIGVVLAKKKR